MAQAIVWSGGKPYEYVDGALQEVRTPGTYTMPDGTKYTYGPDGQVQTLASGQTTAAPVYQGSGQGVPQWLIDQNPGQNISSGDALALGGNASYNIGNQVYTGTQWGGEGSAPWGSNTPGYYSYENTPAMQAAQQTGKLSQLNGSPYSTLDANGNPTGSGTWSNIHDSNKNTTDAIATAIVGSIFGAGAMGALGGAGAAEGAAAGGGAASAGGAGVTGFGDAGLMYGGADAAAAGSLGGGASVAGGSALGAGAAGGVAAGAGGAGAGSGGYGAGVTGFGDAGTMYGGANEASAATLGGGASVNGGAALGTTAAIPAAGSSGSVPSTTAPSGTPPPGNPYLTPTAGTGAMSAIQNILGGNGSASDYAGLLAAVGGAYAGSQGTQNKTSQTLSLDPRLDAAVYGSLVPNVMSTMNGQIPGANAAGQQLMSVGSGLLGTSSTPNFSNNPYLTAAANDLQRRTSDLLGQNNLAIQGNFVGGGGLGGSRQGVAQGVAAGKAADSLQGNLANLYQTQYNTDATRALQQQAIGAGMIAQGQQAPWVPLTNANSIFGNFKSGNSTTVNSQGGGATGALGGLLGGAQYAQNAGLFSGGSGTQSTAWW